MNGKIPKWLVIIGGVIAGVVFGIPLTHSGMRYAAGLDVNGELRLGFVLIWFVLYFGIAILLVWLAIIDGRGHEKALGIVLVGLQLLMLYTAFSEEFDGRMIPAVTVPVLFIAIYVGFIQVLRRYAGRRGKA